MTSQPETAASPLREPAHAWSIIKQTAGRLEQGLSAVPEWYLDPDVFELERQLVFRRTWQLVCPVTDVAEPGSYRAVQIDADTEFIVVRDHDGVLRAFYNVCSHRGNLIVGGHRDYAPFDPPSGKTRLFRCVYHAWSYNLDGTLNRAPGIGGLPGFDQAQYGLREVSVDTWGPFVFLNPDPDALPLAEHLGDLPERVTALGIDMEAVAEEGNFLNVEGILECNWKSAVENALECYHCASSHPGFAESMALPKWQISLRGGCIVQGTRVRPVDPSTIAPDNPKRRLGPLSTEAALSSEGSSLAWFHWMFPNNSVSVWPGPGNSFNVARWIPLEPGRTKWWSVRWWPASVPDEVRDEQWKFMSDVGWEDQEIVENQYLGIKSGAWRGGPLYLAPDTDSPVEDPPPHIDPRELQEVRDERGVHLFNSLVAETLLR